MRDTASPATALASDDMAPLEGLRARLDTVDAALVAALSERMALMAAIAAAKGPDAPVIRPDREAAVLADRLAAAPDLPPALVALQWRLLVSAACLAQRPFQVHAAPGTEEAAAALYPTVPRRGQRSAAQALAALAEAPNDVAMMHEREAIEAAGTHAILSADTAHDRVLVFAGAGVERANGPLSLVAREGRLATTEAPAPGERVVARIHAFPVPLPVSDTVQRKAAS